MFNYDLSYYSPRIGSNYTEWNYTIHPISAVDDDEAIKFAEQFINGPAIGPKRGPITLKKIIKVF